MEERELEDFEIEITIRTQLSKNDILNIEKILGKQLDTLELLRFARITGCFSGISRTLELLDELKKAVS